MPGGHHHIAFTIYDWYSYACAPVRYQSARTSLILQLVAKMAAIFAFGGFVQEPHKHSDEVPYLREFFDEWLHFEG